ncbi:SGNH/GDSL hydrolase family protein [Sagittula sp. NFXS13]|uniref:SGNH/GDSL hydrolase family protein n=1 Tax=Sagittula sp. NFXS13 TaxID=2819095 RepID=UPI0032DFC8A5
MPGIPVTEKPLIPSADTLTAIRDRSTGRISVASLALQMTGAGAIAEELTAIRGQVTSGLLAPPSWSALLSITGSEDAAGAEVPATDTGTHADASATGYDGSMVSNSGRFSWNEAWQRWVRIGDVQGTSTTVALASGGSVNAIEATTLRYVSPVANETLFALPIVSSNTAAVTVSVNDGPALDLVTNSGSPLSAGYLVAGSTVDFRFDGSAYRLTSTVSDAALQADIIAIKDQVKEDQATVASDRAAVELAKHSLNVNAPEGGFDASSPAFPTSLEAGQYWVTTTAGTVDGVEFALGDRIVALVDDASTTTFASNWIKVADASGGFNFTTRDAATAAALAGFPDGSIGLIGGLAYRADSTATGAASATADLLVDGLVPDGFVRDRHFGATGDGSSDDSAAIEAAGPNTVLHVEEGRYVTTVTASKVTLETTAAAQFRDSESGDFAPLTVRKRLADLTFAYGDKIRQSKSGQAPKITCYGDSNTRYYFGGAGPLSKSYGAQLDIIAATRPHLYASTITVRGYPGETAEYGNSNFAANVPSDTDYLVIGYGTNNIKLGSPDWNSYSAAILSIMTKALALGAQPILLGIPWYSANYGTNGVASQHLLRIWNARLYRMAQDCGVPFVDTYSLVWEYPSAYIDETSPQRHYNANATRIIAERIADVLQSLMPSAQPAGWSKVGDWTDLSCLSACTGPIARSQYNNGNRRFEALVVPSGSSITLAGNGRGCFGFYPRASATVEMVAVDENGATKETAMITMSGATDAGQYYPIQREALKFSSGRSASEVTLTATSGTFYLRSASFEDGLILPTTQWNQIVQEIPAAALPPVGVGLREYLVTDLGYAVRWLSDRWYGPLGLWSVGPTADRDAVSAIGCPTGYKFYNTTTGTVERWNGTVWA